MIAGLRQSSLVPNTYNNQATLQQIPIYHMTEDQNSDFQVSASSAIFVGK